MTSQLPVYNLKAVLKETGLNADILRAWERRYDLPKPHRTSGGQRLYSQYDIETVKWLRARQAEGLSISRAAALWKELLAAGRDPLVEFYPGRSAPLVEHAPATDGAIDILRRGWLAACLAFDERKAEEVLDQALGIYPVELVCQEILQKGMYHIGSEWYLNRVSVQQEHFASSQAIRRLETLITTTPRPTREQVVLLGCPAGEWHTLPILMLNLLLRRRGFEAIYLGGDIPIEQLDETAAAIRPGLIILAAQQLTTAAALHAAARAFQGKKPPLAYGGLIFNRLPALREHIPAYFLGEHLTDALDLIEQLLLARPSFPPRLSLEAPSGVLAQHYREKRTIIELRLAERLDKAGLQVDYLADANVFFGNGLSAALDLGDPALLEADLDWVKHLLAGRRLPANQLSPYLAAYRRVLAQELGQEADPITDWIEAYNQSNGAHS